MSNKKDRLKNLHIWAKKWRKAHPILYKKQKKEEYKRWIKWTKENPEKYKEFNRKKAFKRKHSKAYRLFKEKYYNSRKYKIYCRNIRATQKYKLYHKKYGIEYYKNPINKFRNNVRCLIRNSFSLKRIKKQLKSETYLGCSFDTFRGWIESQFTEKMNWKNMGSFWHLDHYIPLNYAQTEEEVIKLSYYKNIRPLEGIKNIQKGCKMPSDSNSKLFELGFAIERMMPGGYYGE